MISKISKKPTPSKNKKNIILIGKNAPLSISDCLHVLKPKIIVKLNPAALSAIKKSYSYLKKCAFDRHTIYGLNTNFGDQVKLLDPHLTTTYHDKYFESIRERQINLIKSHCCGMGDVVPPDIVKLTMLLRAHCLAQGYSGVNPEFLEAYLKFINVDIVPIVYQYGSIGASGDLIPLATIAGAMLGEKVDVLYQGKAMQAARAIKLAKIKPIEPVLREGLAAINGTSFMTSIAVLAINDLTRLFYQLLAAIAMSLESLMVISSAYDPTLHRLKNQKGEMEVNQFLVTFWKGSHLLHSLDELRSQYIAGETLANNKDIKAAQDYYSLRSVAQGFGPFFENILYASAQIENEINSVNDNPVIDYVNKKIYHGANFMGYYITNACDILKMDIAQASTWIHALLANMLNPRKNFNLPSNLIDDREYSGFRPIQILADALAVENRKLAHAHQSFTLPTEGDNQDVNSLGTHAAFDLRFAIENLERLTAILFLTSAQALEYRGIKNASPRSQQYVKMLRTSSPLLTKDRILHFELEKTVNLLRTNVFQFL